MVAEEGSAGGTDGSGSGDRDAEYRRRDRTGDPAESRDPSTGTDPDREYRKWDRASDPPEPGETLASWDRTTRDRVVAGLILVVLLVYGALLYGSIRSAPSVAALYVLTVVVLVALPLPAVRERIPLVRAVAPLLAVSLVATLGLLLLHAEAGDPSAFPALGGRAGAFLVFFAVVYVGTKAVERIRNGR